MIRQRLAAIMGLALSLLLLLPASHGLAAGITHKVSNLGDRAFTVSWTSPVIEQCYVNYGTSPDTLDRTAYDDRGQATRDYTHHVTVTGLEDATTYYYSIVSGGFTCDNNGFPYEITTGPSLDFVMPEIIRGKAFQDSETAPAKGAIVYARVGTSGLLSALVDGNATWAMDISPVRSADGLSYYQHAVGDDLILEAHGGLDSTATQTVTVASAVTGEPDMVLTSSSDRLRVNLQVTPDGRPALPDDCRTVPVTVWIHAAGSPWTANTADSHGAVGCYQTYTDAEGIINIPLEPGAYDIRVKGTSTLMNLVEGVTVETGMAPVTVGPLVQGDINGDNTVSALDYSAMVMCFGYAVDDTAAPAPTANCDLNNDGYVSALDYSVLIMNFGQTGTERGPATGQYTLIYLFEIAFSRTTYRTCPVIRYLLKRSPRSDTAIRVTNIRVIYPSTYGTAVFIFRR